MLLIFQNFFVNNRKYGIKMEPINVFVVRFVVKIREKREGTIMARHGENIRKRADGRWEGRYPIYSEEKGRKSYRSVYGSSYREVKEKLAGQNSCLRKPVELGDKTGDQVSSSCDKILFNDAAKEWFLEIRKSKKQSTYIKYMLIYSNHLEGSFSDMEPRQITDLLVAEKFSGSLSDSTRKSIYCVLNQILKLASRKYSILVPNLKNPALDSCRKPVEVLTRMEQGRLLSILYQETDLFKTAILLCLYTGLRLGELCALKWTDIDLENRIVRVSGTVQRLYIEGKATKTGLLETSPKSEFSKREIPLSAVAADRLEAFKNHETYVFGGKKPVEPRTMQNHFKKIIKEAGLPDKNFHILRHTFATNCVEGGTDVKSLSEILGHSDVQITLNRYVHPSMDTKRRHIDSLSTFYGQIHGQAG